MLIWHQYSWREGVTKQDERRGTNFGLTRLSLDIFLPGSTTLEQVDVSIVDNGMKVNFEYDLPTCYLSTQRSALRLADAMGVCAGTMRAASEFTQAGSRAAGHRAALDEIRPRQRKLTKELPLKFRCDQYWCRCDDWGRDNMVEGVTIGVYRHDDDDLHNNQQYVWMLHLELTLVERPQASPDQRKPTGFRMFMHQM